MSNEEMYNLIIEFKKEAKEKAGLSEIPMKVIAIVLDTFYFWFAARKEK